MGFNRYVIGSLAGIVLAFTLSGAAAFAQAPVPSENLKRAVDYLLDFVADSDCIFIRNGQSYAPKESAEHMRTKYDYFKKQIKTAEDFIRLAASKSLVSGQVYLVKTREGKEIKAADWLAKALDDYRRRQKDSKEDKD